MLRYVYSAVGRRAGFSLASILLAGQVGAAVPVEDMSTRDVRSTLPEAPVSLPGIPGVAGPASGKNAQLFYELQVLQTELQQLRGLVEDQAYEINRLRDLQRSQYLDIDRRLTEDGRSASRLPENVSGQSQSVQSQPAQPNPGATAPQVSSPTPVRGEQVVIPVVQTGTQRPTPVVEPVVSPRVPEVSENSAATGAAPEEVVLASSEELAFDRAFELMKDQQFEQSIVAYQGVVESFPDGSYAPQSRYWLGELYLMSDRLEAARGAFTAVVEVYPAHQKVPLSLYKLGVVNHRLGATPAALEYLDNVVTRYPDTPAAGLARTYAAELRPPLID